MFSLDCPICVFVYLPSENEYCSTVVIHRELTPTCVQPHSPGIIDCRLSILWTKVGGKKLWTRGCKAVRLWGSAVLAGNQFVSSYNNLYRHEAFGFQSTQSWTRDKKMSFSRWPNSPQSKDRDLWQQHHLRPSPNYWPHNRRQLPYLLRSQSTQSQNLDLIKLSSLQTEWIPWPSRWRSLVVTHTTHDGILLWPSTDSMDTAEKMDVEQCQLAPWPPPIRHYECT